MDVLLQVRAWADEQAVQRVLAPIERALPVVQQPRRTSMRASFMAAPGDDLGLDRGLDRRVTKAVTACGACAARIKDLEAAVKQCASLTLLQRQYGCLYQIAVQRHRQSALWAAVNPS